MAYIPKNYARLEVGYREKALKLFPWVCGRCSREFVYSNLRELTVHHIDHDHSNNPEDGSNWEMLCACTVTITNIPSTPKPISMAPRWWQGKMRKRASARPPTTRLPI